MNFKGSCSQDSISVKISLQKKASGVWFALYIQSNKSLTMKEQVPSYVIKYIECSQEGHQGEKVNLICLNDECHQNSLICSLCTPKHRGHTYKPIKIYIDELHRKYQGSAISQQQDLEELQKRKLLLLHHLKICVERVSQEFMKLEEDILFTYEKLKNQIHENEARKSKFQQFYLSMVKDNYGDPHFQIKNYLFRQEIKILTDQDIFQEISRSLEKQVKAVRAHFINQSKSTTDHIKPEEAKLDYLLPPNILKEGQSIWQTNYALNSPNLCLFNVRIGSWTSKLRIHIMTLPHGSKITMGLIRKEEFVKAGNIFKDELNCMYVDSLGKSKAVQHNYLGVLPANSIIDFFVKKNNFRINCKNNNSLMNLMDKNYYFFFALEGNCKIKLTYPHAK